MADLSHSLYVADKGLMLKVSGYSENLHVSETITFTCRLPISASRGSVSKKSSSNKTGEQHRV